MLAFEQSELRRFREPTLKMIYDGLADLIQCARIQDV